MSNNKGKEYWNKLAHLDPEAAVIDPLDTAGRKNRYLAQTRDIAFSRFMKRNNIKSGLIIDIGCGTGSAALSLSKAGHRVIGLDISHGLLLRATERCDPKTCSFLLTDGKTIPLASSISDAAVIYVVMSYIVNDDDVISLLQEIRRVLRPGAPIAIIEQVRKKRTLLDEGLKIQRTRIEWKRLLASANFTVKRSLTLRHGRFPTTPAIRAGLLPEYLWPWARFLDSGIGRMFGVFPWDYAEIMFEANT